MEPLIPLFVKDEQSESFDLEGEVASLAMSVGWSNVLKEAFHVLERSSKRRYWHQASSILYWAASDGISFPYPTPETTARLYLCLERYPGFGKAGLEAGENLVWSIVSTLKGVSYESEWDPLQDSSVVEKMARLRDES